MQKGPYVMQQTQEQFHALLKERVRKARQKFEDATKLLAVFEQSFLNPDANDDDEDLLETLPLAEAPTAPAPRVEVRTEAPTPAPRGVNKDGTATKKPGPAKGVNVNAAKARAKASTKATQPAKVKKVAKAAPKKPAVAAKAKNHKAVAKTKTTASKPGPKPGSKREGVPSLIKAIQIVMGRKTLNADQVHEALKAKTWLPNSSDPIGYIRYTLSKNKDIFLRVEGKRGHYHLGEANIVKPANGVTERKTSTRSEPVADVLQGAPEENDENVSAVVEEASDLLAKSGVDLSGANPFADQPSS